MPDAGTHQLLRDSSVDYQDPNKGAAVRGMFAGIAHCYDRMNRLLSFNRDRVWRRRAVAMADVKPSDAVLDVCCGTGDFALEFHKALTGLGATSPQVFGADFTPEMLRIARDKNAPAQANVPYMAADTLSLPFADSSFDVCAVAFGIRNVQDVEAGIREMARVVKPGGRIVILEFTQPKGRLLAGLMRWYLTRVLPRIGQWFSRSKEKAYSYLPDSIALFPPPERLAATMERCGLKHVRYRLMNCRLVAIHVGTK